MAIEYEIKRRMKRAKVTYAILSERTGRPHGSLAPIINGCGTMSFDLRRQIEKILSDAEDQQKNETGKNE